MAVQIEQTSKRYKGRMLLAMLLCCVGVVLMMARDTPTWGLVVLVSGALLYLVARFQAWWNHG